MFKFFLKTKEFILQVKSEFSKISWLSFRKTLSYSVLVIFVATLAAIFLGGMDFIILKILRLIIP
jgi:preprotein translocase SecE subunit